MENDNVTVLYDVNQLIEAVADELATVYFENTDDNNNTNTAGLKTMQETMDGLPLTVRAPVFALFLTKLQEAGVDYDTSEFEVRYH
ncbi:MAG TPA: hypothetical protein VKA31_11285 [Mariprofundaceae bacterium]|nr:hypothetical protein [Mariprofundaceae bacterium]